MTPEKLTTFLAGFPAFEAAQRDPNGHHDNDVDSDFNIDDTDTGKMAAIDINVENVACP